VRGALIIAPRVKLAHVRESIVLADAACDISFAHDSIIIARCAAEVSHLRNSILLTGFASQASHADKSVMLSGVQASASHARTSVLGGAEACRFSFAREGTVLLNSPGVEPRRLRHGARQIRTEKLVLRDERANSPLDEKLTLTFTHQDARGGLALFRLKDGTGEYVARVDQEIRNPAGDPLPELKGWKLIFAGNRIAVFGDGKEFAHVTHAR